MPSGRQVPEDVYDEIVQMLKEGFTPNEISEETGWAKGTIRKIRREAGFYGRHIDPLRGLDTDAIVTEYREGERVLDICIKHEINSQKFYKILALIGEPLRTKDPTYQEARARAMEEAVQMYKDGWYIYDITEETGIGQVSLHKEVKKRDIPLRRPR